jgi:hypothetical protein
VEWLDLAPHGRAGLGDVDELEAHVAGEGHLAGLP